jgi:signal transduction histidine kinase/ligand-binding sensor domain-containing protein/DNA-binding response OmpR family regulator
MKQFRIFISSSLFSRRALILLLPLCVYSQPAKFIKYSTQLGLSSNSQRCIIQDNEGFIWIGTGDGLNRFDGRAFKVYRRNPTDSTSLRSNNIVCLYVDTKGVLWIGTYQGGLSRYDKENDNFYTYASMNDIVSISEDKHHKLWAGSTTQGLYLFNPEINRFIRYQTQMQDAAGTTANVLINKFVIDGEILWIAYNTGTLTALNTTTGACTSYKLFNVSSSRTADFSINSLVVDSDRIWISTWSKGMWIFDKTTGRCIPFKNEKSKYINFVFKDNRNRLWYSPESKGLILIDGKKEIHYLFDDFDRYSLSSNSLANIFQDKQGNLWLASKQGDLNYFILDNPFFTWYKNPNSVDGLTSNFINAVIEDSKGRIWIGFENGGIDILDPKNVRPRIHLAGDAITGLGPGPIMYIYESKKGTIWIGKYLDGLKRYNEATKSFSSYQHRENDDESLAGNDVRYISEDNAGDLWIAIHGGGVDKFIPEIGKFIHHKNDPAHPLNTIATDWTYSAICDNRGNIWIGSVVGVSVLSENTPLVKHFTANAEEGYDLSNDLVRAIFFDSKGFIWFGTTDGLDKLNPRNNAIKRYSTKDGLPNNVITDIREDGHYNLWISTTKGLSKFSPELENFHNYSLDDGLVTDNFNTFASFKNRRGELYFGGRDGLIRFHPDSIKVNNFKPPVFITDFKLFNRSVPARNEHDQSEFSIPKQISFCKEITLDYDQNVFTLEYIALNYLNLGKNQYKYKLEGFEKDWTLAGNRRDVTYTNLHPGKYVFRVIASNNDRIWNTEGTSLTIIVNPPYWRTNWAYAVYALLIISILYFFRKWILHEAGIKRMLELEELEIQKLHEMDTLKTQFFSNVSHEFRTPLTLIVGPLEQLLRASKNEMQKIQLGLIQRNTNRLMRLINQLMDFGKIEEARLELTLAKHDIVLFIKDIVGAFNREAKERNIDYSFIPSHPFFEVWFDADKLDKILYNLLSNAFKYTPDNGAITVSLTMDGERVEHIRRNPEMPIREKELYRITVKDTGIGISQESQSRIFDRFYQAKNALTTRGTGIGLSLTRELVRLHHGSIFVQSEPGKGSEFSVVLPLWIEEKELPRLSTIRKESEMRVEQNEDGIKKVEGSEAPDSLSDQSDPSSELPRILIIEDNADMRLFIKNEFRDTYCFSEAHNGTAGVEKAINDIPDVIICDIMMPGINGYEVCRILKQDERTSHIPVIMLTARSSEQYAIEGLESGADDYIAKPFNSALLRARLKNLINSRTLLRKKFISEPFAPIKDISPSKVDERLLKRAYEIVAKNLSNPEFGVPDFARELRMSRAQLYRKIFAISGQSVKEFIRIIRLKKAAELLLQREKNISEIAFTVGFNSLSYFTTSFTDYFGLNPTKYIERYTK